jgi:hypothetical protein
MKSTLTFDLNGASGASGHIRDGHDFRVAKGVVANVLDRGHQRSGNARIRFVSERLSLAGGLCGVLSSLSFALLFLFEDIIDSHAGK